MEKDYKIEFRPAEFPILEIKLPVVRPGDGFRGTPDTILFRLERYRGAEVIIGDVTYSVDDRDLAALAAAIVNYFPGPDRKVSVISPPGQELSIKHTYTGPCMAE